MLIIKNRVLRLGNVHIWLDSPFYVVDLLILRNCIIRIRNVQYGLCCLEGGRSADIHEICFQAAKRLNMDCVELQGGLFVDSLA